MSNDDLTRVLRDRADSVADSHLTLDDVRGRAGRIRRRRAAGVAAGVALVAAVVLPLTLLGGSPLDRTDAPVTNPTRATSPEPSPEPTTLQDGVIIGPDVRAPLALGAGEHADGFALLGEDRYVVTVQTTDGDRRVGLFDRTGRQRGSWPLSGETAVGAASGAVAWVSPDGVPLLLVAGTDAARPLTAVSGTDPAAVAVTGDCTELCQVYVQVTGERGLGPTWVVSTNGAVDKAPDAVPAVADVTYDGSLLAGIDSFADDDIHSCGGVYDVGTDDYLWQGCEANMFHFSPDGGLVATAFGEGRGPTGVDLRDAHSGAVVASLAGYGWIPSFSWQDSTHLLVVAVADDGSTSVQRVGPDGDTETVLEGYTTTADGPVPVILPAG